MSAVIIHAGLDYEGGPGMAWAAWPSDDLEEGAHLANGYAPRCPRKRADIARKAILHARVRLRRWRPYYRLDWSAATWVPGLDPRQVTITVPLLAA